MSLPSTLEEMQFQILQGDLSGNPYLQPNVIAGKDKELKTTAKKIIPAINELLKTVGVVSSSMQGFTDEMNKGLNDLAVELKAYTDKGLEENVRVNTENIEALQQLMEEYMNQSLAEKIEEMQTSYDAKLQELEAKLTELIASGGSNGGAGAGTGGEEMKKVFHSKMELPKNGSIVAPLKFSELQDAKKQIVVTSYSEYSSKYVMNEGPFAIGNESGSLYKIRTYPVDFRVNTETDEIILADRAGLNGHMIYFYTME